MTLSLSIATSYFKHINIYIFSPPLMNYHKHHHHHHPLVALLVANQSAYSFNFTPHIYMP